MRSHTETIIEEVTTMAGIGWETDFEEALQRVRETKKPLFQDFWFDG